MVVDIFGNNIKLDDSVAFGEGNTMHIGTIVKITPKMLRVKTFRNNRTFLRYQKDVMVLDPAKVTYYLLQHA